MKKYVFLGIVIGVTIVIYFIPKTIESCAVFPQFSPPVSCSIYTCERGFPYKPYTFGGQLAECFLGGEPILMNK
jgi:hypothetical protein